MSKGIVKIAIIVFWLLLWQIASMLIGQEILLVSPVSASSALLKLIKSASFWVSVVNSLSHILVGFILASFLGLILGIIAGRSLLIEGVLSPFIQTIKSIPVASFVILILIWVSPRDLSTVISGLMVFPLMYSNILTGMKAIDPKLLEFAQVFKINRRGRWCALYGVSLLPYFRAACSLGLGLCWKAGIAAEVIGLPAQSIGEHLFEAKVYLSTPDLFAWTLVIVIISLCFEKLFVFALNQLVEWGLKHL